MSINELISDLITIKEQGYSDDPADRGGPTRYGITEDVARMSGYKGAMDKLPITLAEALYMRLYWSNPGFDFVAQVSEETAIRLFDMGVVCGAHFASSALQRILNVMNNNQVLYKDIVIDGVIGPRTIGALKEYDNHRCPHGMVELIKALNNIQGNRFLEICERDPSQERFYYGWISKRID